MPNRPFLGLIRPDGEVCSTALTPSISDVQAFSLATRHYIVGDLCELVDLAKALAEASTHLAALLRPSIESAKPLIADLGELPDDVILSTLRTFVTSATLDRSHPLNLKQRGDLTGRHS